ncbi:helix-turn-helix domain-containing protein [Cytobacillus horneckiae]|uniref:helix-turn-helix domain-containing protein n=1 Tax=Cytobacillus horneckiae TaxID=549687 RepID=UPI003D9AB4C4
MLGDRLKILRSERKLTQEELASKIGVTRGTYAHYEINKRQPDYDTLIKLADFFEVSTDYLLKGEDFYSQAKNILDNPDLQYAARDGEISEAEALDRIARILEKQKGRVPGQRQPRPKPRRN